MHFCVHCGARVEDAAQPLCPRCGAPLAAGERRPGTTGPGGYLRVGATRLPGWLPWALGAVLVAGGVTLAVAVADRPDSSSAGGFPAGLVTPGQSYDGAGLSPSPYDPGYETPPTHPADDYSSPAGQPSDDSGGDTPEPSDTGDGSTVVTRYYDHINAGDYTAAWNMGGSTLYPGSYADWVAGFATTAHVDVTASDDGSGTVSVDIRATQDDGTVSVFKGTYAVSGGKITGADIRQVS
ncbi:zinc-ribbon domain-containing protein [Streptomyces sp. NRRL S-31]|uniref:zinc-ribbon domain-containing protein n=1 Tax=Streptomyces sp. NRRL S-31 TaxID=1463898 RepID=UPI00069BAF63|nr:zinc-ribbon domain-containing protein [Streptomyces sp. NRRL S-31]